MNPSIESNDPSPLSPAYAGNDTDQSLVRSAVAGDRAALEQLVARHQGFIYSLAQRMLYSPAITIARKSLACDRQSAMTEPTAVSDPIQTLSAVKC